MFELLYLSNKLLARSDDELSIANCNAKTHASFAVLQKHHFGNSNNNQQQKNVQKNYRTCQKMFLSCSIRHSMTQIVCNVIPLSLDAICVFYSCSQTATVHQFDINRFVIKLLHTLCNRHGVSGGTLYDVSYSILVLQSNCIYSRSLQYRLSLATTSKFYSNFCIYKF